MFILSWNVRVLRGANRKSHLRKIIFKHKVDIVVVLEAKCEDISFPWVRNIMGNLEWKFIELIGLSSGLLLLWNKDCFCFMEPVFSNLDFD